MVNNPSSLVWPKSLTPPAFLQAATIFDDLVSPRNRENLLRQTDETCTLITALPRPETHPGQPFAAPYLTVMDWGHDERDYAAGHSDQAPRLAPEAWAGMIANIRAIAELARDRHGVRAVIHPHAGGYLEFEDPGSVENMQLADGPTLGRLLTATGVPVLVLNACRSAYAEARQEPGQEPGEAPSDVHARIRVARSAATVLGQDAFFFPLADLFVHLLPRGAHQSAEILL